MGVVSGILYGGRTSAPAGDTGDANAWDLTSIIDVPDGVAIGDYGVLDDRVYQYTTINVATGAGGGSQLLWVPPEVAAWTLPEIVAYLNGDEDATARGNQGWTDNITGTGSITGDVGGTGFTRITETGSAASTSLQALIGGVAAGTKIYVRAIATGESENVSVCGWIIADGANVTRFFDSDNALTFRSNQSTLINPSEVRDDGYRLADAPSGALWETIDEGRTVYATAYRNGAAYHATQRTSGTTSVNRVEVTAYRGAGATRVPQLDVRRLIVIAGS